MSKQKSSEPLLRNLKKPNTSTDFVYYQPASHPKVKKVSATRVGKRPIYHFFTDYDGNYFPLRCMLDLGSTSFVISPEAAKAFSICVVLRPKPAKAGDVSGSQLKTEGLFTVPLGVSFDNHRSFDEDSHAFEVIKTSGDYDALIPAWYLEKHKARGTTTSHLHFPHCPQECYNHGKIHPEYSITYDTRIALNNAAIHHQQKIFPTGRNGSVRVDALRQSRQRHPGGGLLRAQRQFNASHSISPSDRCFTVSSCSVGLLF